MSNIDYQLKTSTLNNGKIRNSYTLIKNNIEIAKLILKTNPKFYHYISDKIKNNKELKIYKQTTYGRIIFFYGLT